VKKLRRSHKFIFEIVVLPFLLSGLFSSVYLNRVENQKPWFSNDLITRIVPLTYTRLEEREEHIYLGPRESVPFSASNPSEGFKFRGTDVIMDATNRLFLREISTDLYVETYDYWDGNLGAWTPNNIFTVTNPGGEIQELFLKIINRYSRTTYVTDIANGTEHSIAFTTDTAADRVIVSWGFFGALKYLEVNGSQVDVSDVASFNRSSIMLENFPYASAFHLPHPLRIQNTTFVIKLEERKLPMRPESPCIAAILINNDVITLNPRQEFLFEIPEVEGWTYSNGALFCNVTPSIYPTPYPFKLVNLAVWNPEETPVSATPLDTTFGIRNLSNKTYHVTFDTALYYCQNQTGLTYSHQIVNSTETWIYHKLSVNVSNAKVGAELGFKGQYLMFGSTGKIIRYDAPDPVGRFEGSYIPLKKGSFTLITMEPRITSNITISVDDLHLSATLNLIVMYDGAPYANAKISVLQRGMFTSANYESSTDENGIANIVVRASGPEVESLDITVTKDAFNYEKKIITVTVGTLWISAAVFVVATVTLSFLYLRMRRARATHNLKIP